MRWWLIAKAPARSARWIALLLVVGLAACRGEATHALTVIVDIGQSGSICESAAGTDLDGVHVTVRDGDGAPVAKGALGPGAQPTGPSRIRVCRFQASLEVPDRPSYAVTVDDGDELTYSRADLERRPPWVVSYVGLHLPPAG